MKCMEYYCMNKVEYNYKYNSNPAYCSKHMKLNNNNRGLEHK